MQLKELKAKSAGELKTLLAEKREALRAARFSVSAKQLKDVKAIKKTKKIIAQILTLLAAGERQPKSQRIDSAKK